jgi:hypothetical protein
MRLLSGWNVLGDGWENRNDSNAMFGMCQWILFCRGCNQLRTMYRGVYREYVRINVVYGDDGSRVYCVHVMYEPFEWYCFVDWVFRNIRTRNMFVQL